MARVILASTSKYRAALLRRWQMPFETLDPSVDESIYKTRGLPPRELVAALSRAKAEAIASQHPDAIVIGSDQVLCRGSKIYGKAGSFERAIEDLMQVAGSEQELLTGLCVRHGHEIFEHLDTTKIKLRAFLREEAERIVRLDASWDCAGSLKVEAAGTWLIESLETRDPSAIEGLPLLALGNVLRKVGVGSDLFGGNP